VDRARKINELILIAEKEAKAKVASLGKAFEIRPGKDKKPWKYDFFTQFFHEAMDRMTIEAGIRFRPEG
jgi:hypothetical protein